MNKRASVLMVSLWILAMLAVLAVSVGQRVALALKLSRYEKDNLKAYYLAKAGINWAIKQILSDSASEDSLRDNWVDNETLFKEIKLEDKPNEFATVSYLTEENNTPKAVYGVVDEERKININEAPKELISSLLKSLGVSSADIIAENICAWRGDKNVSIPDYTEFGYTNKGDKFKNIEELILVKGIDAEIYRHLKPLITVWGSDKVNINTAPKEIIEILVEYCRQNNTPQDLVNRIMGLRGINIVIKAAGDLQNELNKLQPLAPEQITIINELLEFIDVKSSCFYISSGGRIKDNLLSKIDCLFDRNNNKIIYWHER